MNSKQIEEFYKGRVVKADVKLAMNRMKMTSIKTLKEGLKTGKKSASQINSAYAILLLVKEYEYSN